MQMAAEEALCIGAPLITNRSNILEEVFGSAALYVDLNVDDLIQALDVIIDQNDEYRHRMLARREERRENMQRTFQTIRSELKT